VLVCPEENQRERGGRREDEKKNQETAGGYRKRRWKGCGKSRAEVRQGVRVGGWIGGQAERREEGIEVAWESGRVQREVGRVQREGVQGGVLE
jgi:hypothetical protein